MVVSMIYHTLDNFKDDYPKLFHSFQFIDFYCAILVMITLSAFTVKIDDKYKGIPHTILGTFSLFMISYELEDVRVELIIAGGCFFMVFGILLCRKRCPEFKKHNVIKGSIFAISGIGCFHITYYIDTIPYWITHTLWHVFIMISAFYILRIHVMNEIMRRVSSIENFIRSRMSNNMEMQNLEEI
jgi:predicted membrane channel-forming protein YqfA (hemolysin III family)